MVDVVLLKLTGWWSMVFNRLNLNRVERRPPIGFAPKFMIFSGKIVLGGIDFAPKLIIGPGACYAKPMFTKQTMGWGLQGNVLGTKWHQ